MVTHTNCSAESSFIEECVEHIWKLLNGKSATAASLYHQIDVFDAETPLLPKDDALSDKLTSYAKMTTSFCEEFKRFACFFWFLCIFLPFVIPVINDNRSTGSLWSKELIESSYLQRGYATLVMFCVILNNIYHKLKNSYAAMKVVYGMNIKKCNFLL
jgi:hypothetical protein